jgi:tRNA C32,U32 (ribose-2'-O)-methylase TrmJ
MPTQEQAQLLVEHLESVLKHLAYENYKPSGSCCACLQDVDTYGHLPSCIIHRALIEIEEWRE